ncbi:hypothetical protein T484DRAFT_1843687 [Baffinella frigidus]|nr:hypothetical protein T484DRAFT_1843687 [Cryptophyta sp. CCMP2293]
MLEVCAGLKAIHELGVLHRDIKPANIVRAAGGQHKLIDLGTAQVADLSDASSFSSASTYTIDN